MTMDGGAAMCFERELSCCSGGFAGAHDNSVYKNDVKKVRMCIRAIPIMIATRPQCKP